MNATLGCLAPAMRHETLSRHFSDLISLRKLVMPGSNTSVASRLLLRFTLLSSFPPLPLLLLEFGLKLFGTSTGWSSSELSRNNRDSSMGNAAKDKTAGKSKVSFRALAMASSLTLKMSSSSFNLNNISSMALMKPSALSLAAASLSSASMPILCMSTDILWLALGWRISAMIGTGRDACATGSLYQPIMPSPMPPLPPPPPPPNHPLEGFL